MINWKEIGGLHVISKLEEILNKWFGVDLFYADPHNRVKSIVEGGPGYRNYFMKSQMKSMKGSDLLLQDVEKIGQKIMDFGDSAMAFQSAYPEVKGMAARIQIGGQFMGSIVVYPFVPMNFSAQDKEKLKNRFIEAGGSESEANQVIDGLKKLGPIDLEYLKDLTELVAQEIVTFTEEIGKREERISDLNMELGKQHKYHMMIGKSKRMQQIYALLEKIKNSESSILIQGENGTGKELVAKAIHFDSARKDAAFVAQNCSAFNDNLLDSELFGHVKGAFTGAIKDKKGLFETANGGTLFLDEIGDTSLSMQVKLLRVLQEGTFIPVGGTTPKRVNVRMLAATNKNLKEMMIKGEFREDLYYRLNVINLQVPALRERKEDIPVLVDHFLEKKCAEAGIPTKVLSKKCLEKLLDFPWPGNVRELQNEIERLVVLAGEDKTIMPEMISARILDASRDNSTVGSAINANGNLKTSMEELEHVMIREGLKRCNFNKSKLAKELGISRASLIMKVEKYGLDKRKKAAGE